MNEIVILILAIVVVSVLAYMFGVSCEHSRVKRFKKSAVYPFPKDEDILEIFMYDDRLVLTLKNKGFYSLHDQHGK